MKSRGSASRSARGPSTCPRRRSGSCSCSQASPTWSASSSRWRTRTCRPASRSAACSPRARPWCPARSGVTSGAAWRRFAWRTTCRIVARSSGSSWTSRARCPREMPCIAAPLRRTFRTRSRTSPCPRVRWRRRSARWDRGTSARSAAATTSSSSIATRRARSTCWCTPARAGWGPQSACIIHTNPARPLRRKWRLAHRRRRRSSGSTWAASRGAHILQTTRGRSTSRGTTGRRSRRARSRLSRSTSRSRPTRTTTSCSRSDGWARRSTCTERARSPRRTALSRWYQDRWGRRATWSAARGARTRLARARTARGA